MKTRTIALFLCALFLSTAFLGVGYAALTDTLSVQGTASAKPGAYVYISDAVATSGTATGITKSGTVLGSTVTLGNSASAQTILRVTVKNNTEYPYVFNGVTYTEGPETYDNTAIAVSTSIKKGVEVASGTSTTFDVTFKYKSGVSANKVLNSIINLSFIPADEFIPEIAVKGAIGQFGVILNDSVSYNKLITAMDNTAGGRANNTYMGNVAGATDADSRVIDELFTVDGKHLLTLDLKGDGSETNVTAMIKREDIGGTSAAEMVIYMTGETISGSLFRPSDVQVFAAIYVQDASGEWVQKGELFEGTARSNNYSGGWGSHNSFNTDTWESTKAYNGVKSGSTIEQVLAGVPD